jgi:uncharacterized membrane protein YgcG
MTKTFLKSFIISSFFVYAILIVGKVYSDNLEISGNASGSNNSINIDQDDTNTVNQSNTVDVENNVKATAETGGNSANDNVGGVTIKTGDATTNVNIKNQFNTNSADVNCKNCATPTPTPKPSPTQPVGGPISDPGSPTSGSAGGSSSSGGGGSSSGGSTGGAGQGQVQGLSATSGDKTLFTTIAGFLLIFLGYTFLRRNATV